MKKLVYTLLISLFCIITQSQTLRLSSSQVKPGETIYVDFTAPSSYADNAWVGIIPSSVQHGSEATNDKYDLSYQYLKKRTSGRLEFKAPAKEGTFDFRMHDTDSNGKEVASVSFVVSNSNQSAVPVSGGQTSSTKASAGLVSNFDGSSVDGWKLNAGKMTNPGRNGSDGGGYLHISAPGEGVTSYLIAPSRFHGNWSSAKSVSVQIWIGPGEYYTKRSGAVGDIVLKSGSKTARYYFPQKPSTSSWRKILIPLTPSNGWEFDGGARSLSDVLGNVTDFQIRAEYIIGDTETGVDEVVVDGNLTSETSAGSTANTVQLPIDIAGSWNSGGSRNQIARVHIWQNGNEFVVISCWPDETTGKWKSYRGEGRFEGRNMNFTVYPSTTDGSSADQGYVQHWTVSSDNGEISGYYTRYGKRTVDTNVLYKLVK